MANTKMVGTIHVDANIVPFGVSIHKEVILPREKVSEPLQTTFKFPTTTVSSGNFILSKKIN